MGDPVMDGLASYLRDRDREALRDAEIEQRANAIFARMNQSPCAQDIFDALGGYINETDAARLATEYARRDALEMGCILGGIFAKGFYEIALAQAITEVERLEREATLDLIDERMV